MTKSPSAAAVPARKRTSTGTKKSGRTGHISERTRLIIWARSGGICSAPGCGKVLHRDSNYLSPGTFGELAHNVAASEKGPRGDAVRSKILVDDPENLIMMCPGCHTQIDKGGAKQYPEELLRSWKLDHEAAVEMLGKIQGNRKARLLICTGNIRGRVCNIEQAAAVRAAVQAGYQPLSAPFKIALPDNHAQDGSQFWWEGQANALRQEVHSAMRMDKHEERTLAVFAVAEMPSLILLGYLLGDEQKLELFQYDRTSGSCNFSDVDGPAAAFEIRCPSVVSMDGVALIISATATVTEDRITSSVPDKNLAIAEIRAVNPGRTVVQSPATVRAFQKAVIECIDRIEAAAGSKVPIHVFPAMPAPLAVALGAGIMPKAPVQLVIYDSSGVDGIFRPALTLPINGA